MALELVGQAVVCSPADACDSAPSPRAQRVGITRCDARVESGALTASFELDARPHRGWQGAFARAIDGQLTGLAGRWRFDVNAIAVTRVRPGRAAAVARAVA